MLATAVAAHGQELTTYFVDASAPAGGDGLSWSSAFRDLTDALTASPNHLPREIRISQGVYRPDQGSGDRTRSFTTTSAATVNLLGGFAGRQSATPDARNPSMYVTVLSGDLNDDDLPNLDNRLDNSYTVVRVQSESRSVTIDGLTIRGGAATETTDDGSFSRGGGIRLRRGPFTRSKTVVRNCAFLENTAYSSGGALELADNVVVEGCVFVSNRAFGGPGGAIHVQTPNARVAVSRCTFDRNLAQYGGAIALGSIGGDTTVQRCVFAGNQATYGSGGALATTTTAFGYSLSVLGCVFTGNTAWSGGGAFRILEPAASVDLRNLACFANEADYANSLLLGASNSRISSCILWGGRSQIQVGVQSASGSVISDCDIQGGLAGIAGTFIATQSILNVNPLFANPYGPDGDPTTWQDNDLRLSPFSPLIDAGPVPTAEVSSLLDLDGNPFKADGNLDGDPRIDIGAYEFRAGPLGCPADFNADHAITPADVADYVRVWLEALSSGCP